MQPEDGMHLSLNMVLIDDFLFNADGFAGADVSGFAEAV